MVRVLRDGTVTAPWTLAEENESLTHYRIDRPREREELLAQIRRLAGIVLDRMEEGSRERMLDPGQTRMLGTTALRILKLWQEVSGRGTPSWAARAWLGKTAEALEESHAKDVARDE